MSIDFKRFDSKHLFGEALRNGINLFCGAGFSVLAMDKLKRLLPTGQALLNEMKEEFSDISSYSTLSKACTKLVRSDKKSFYDFLNKRFVVDEFDPLYLRLLEIDLKSIYTTNIDNLFFRIFEKSESSRYLHDRSNGAELGDHLAIDYFPLHGCVQNRGDYVFGATEVASAFSQQGTEKSWRNLANDSSKNPILFWGWNFEDAGPIEAMSILGN